jgi:hypothetical protein
VDWIHIAELTLTVGLGIIVAVVAARVAADGRHITDGSRPSALGAVAAAVSAVLAVTLSVAAGPTAAAVAALAFRDLASRREVLARLPVVGVAVLVATHAAHAGPVGAWSAVAAAGVLLEAAVRLSFKVVVVSAGTVATTTAIAFALGAAQLDAAPPFVPLAVTLLVSLAVAERTAMRVALTAVARGSRFATRHARLSSGVVQGLIAATAIAGICGPGLPYAGSLHTVDAVTFIVAVSCLAATWFYWRVGRVVLPLVIATADALLGTPALGVPTAVVVFAWMSYWNAALRRRPEAAETHLVVERQLRGRQRLMRALTLFTALAVARAAVSSLLVV